MRNSGKWITITVCLALAATMAVAGIRGDRQPHRYAPASLDQAPVLAVNPVDGSTLAAWGYRESGEYSIAVAVKTGDSWSEPTFFGRDDRLDQIDPAVVFDSRGVAYLAFTVVQLQEVRITAIAGDPRQALVPQVVSPDGITVATPALRIFADRLAVAFRAGDTVVIRDLPLFLAGGGYSSLGIQEGPDAVDPLGFIWQGNGKDSEESGSGDRWESEDGQDPAASVPLAQR